MQKVDGYILCRHVFFRLPGTDVTSFAFYCTCTELLITEEVYVTSKCCLKANVKQVDTRQ